MLRCPHRVCCWGPVSGACAHTRPEGTKAAIIVRTLVGRRDVFESQQPLVSLGNRTFLLANPIARTAGSQGRVTMLVAKRSIRLSRSKQVAFPVGYAGGAVVESLHHLALIQRQVQLLALLPAVALDGVEALGVKLRRRAEQVRVVGHIEHAHVPDRPGAALLMLCPVHQHRMPLVDAARDLRVPPRAEDGRGAGVGVDAGEVRSVSQREAAVGVADHASVGQEESALGLVELPPRTAKDEGAELEPRVHIGEEGRQLCSETAVLEVEQASETSAGGDGLEEDGGGFVGVDARRREQAHEAVRLDRGSWRARRTASRG